MRQRLKKGPNFKLQTSKKFQGPNFKLQFQNNTRAARPSRGSSEKRQALSFRRRSVVNGLFTFIGAFLDTSRCECYHHARCLPSKIGPSKTGATPLRLSILLYFLPSCSSLF